MSVPHISGNFADLLDPRFQKVFNDQFAQLPDMLPTVYNMQGSNGRDEVKFSETGAFQDPEEFNGTVSYQSVTQGFDTTMTPIEIASGFQIERKLFDDNQYKGAFEGKPSGLARAAVRLRQKHGARLFNNAFSVDTKFYNNSEGVALCSNSHTSTNPNADTSVGFDNLVTSALSATAVIAARTQMVDFRDDVSNKFSVEPDELFLPVNLWSEGLEIVNSMGKPDTADNNINVLQGSLKPIEWTYLTDNNNWFMSDSAQRMDMAYWTDRVPVELAMVEDFDTLIAKWRLYGRWAQSHTNWRFILGAQVT